MSDLIHMQIANHPRGVKVSPFGEDLPEGCPGWGGFYPHHISCLLCDRSSLCAASWLGSLVEHLNLAEGRKKRVKRDPNPFKRDTAAYTLFGMLIESILAIRKRKQQKATFESLLDNLPGAHTDVLEEVFTMLDAGEAVENQDDPRIQAYRAAFSVGEDGETIRFFVKHVRATTKALASGKELSEILLLLDS